ncbi:MAG: C39 family peptidase [Negativicutes bacterium]
MNCVPPVKGAHGIAFSAWAHLHSLRKVYHKKHLYYIFNVDCILDVLSTEVKPDQENGTNYLNVASFAKSLGFDVNIRTHMTLDELKRHIDQKRPILLAIQAWADSKFSYLSNQNEDGHYVVAIGYDDKNFYFMDPSTLGHYTYIFLRRNLHHVGMTTIRTATKPYFGLA